MECGVMEPERRLSRGKQDDFHVGPGDARSQSGSQSLEGRFLCSKANGKSGSGVASGEGIRLLTLGEHAFEESLTMAIHHRADSGDLDHVDAVPDDHHASASKA